MPNKIILSKPPRGTTDLSHRVWLDWLNTLYNRVGDGPFLLRSYSVASLPAASEWGSLVSEKEYSSLIFVHDETGGSTLAFSDGTNWRRVQDRAIVS